MVPQPFRTCCRAGQFFFVAVRFGPDLHFPNAHRRSETAMVCEYAKN